MIRNGVDVDSLQQARPLPRTESGLAPDEFIVLMAGRLTPQKSPHLLIEALHLLQQQHLPRRIRLLIAGEGPESQSLKTLATQLPDPSAVSFLGWRSDLDRLLKTADLFVLPSAWEGLPNVLLEAQASGLPVAATAIDGCTDVIQSGSTGLLFPPNTPTAIADIIAAQVRNPIPAKTMAAAALAQLQQSGRWDACIDQFDQLLRSDGRPITGN